MISKEIEDKLTIVYTHSDFQVDDWEELSYAYYTNENNYTQWYYKEIGGCSCDYPGDSQLGEVEWQFADLAYQLGKQKYKLEDNKELKQFFLTYHNTERLQKILTAIENKQFIRDL